MSSQSSDRDPVEKLAEEFAERYRRGERPSVTEYTDEYPDLAGQIRDLFPALIEMEQLGSMENSPTGPHIPSVPGDGVPLQRLGEYRILRQVGRGGMAVVYEAVQESLGRHVALKVLPFQALGNPTYLERFRREAKAAARLHHTNIVPVFGVGEDKGVHYYAMQFIQGQSLDLVLHELKVLRAAKAGPGLPRDSAGPALTVSVAQGLLTGQFPEQQSAGAALGAGPATGTAKGSDLPGNANLGLAFPGAPDPASATVKLSAASDSGTSQSEFTHQPLAQYFRSVARVGVQVAEALDYAHRNGILHRDIKPSNLLLDTQGTVWVGDFGLAKAEDSDELTNPGDIVGTLRFMAPERFQGQADPRSDVYSLGITLYELLTLQPAFDGSDRAQLVERVVHEEPPRPRKVDPQIPRDLETVVLKAIAKDPAERYPSAEALAQDLGRFLGGEPIRARRIGTWERAVKWAKRRPAAAALVAVSGLAALALVGLAVGLWYNGELQGALHEAEKQRAEAEKQQAEAEKQQGEAHWQRKRFEDLEANTRYLRNISQAEQAWQEARIGQTLRLLGLWRPKGEGEPDPRGWEWYYLRGLCHTEFRTLQTNEPAEFSNVAFHPDSRRVAVADVKNKIHIWDVGDGQKLCTLTGHTSQVDAVAFSPDGGMLASASWDGTVRVWDAANGQQTHSFKANVRFRGVTFSPDGKYLAAAATDGMATLWAMPGGALLRRFAGHFDIVHCVTFSPDGRRLATASVDKTVRIWDAASGECLRILRGHAHQVSGVAFSPDGQTLATSSEDRTVKLWDWATGRVRWTLEEHSAWVYRVAFSPDGRWLASVSDDMTVRLWDVARGKTASIFRGHEGNYLRGVAFSPDGRFLATSAMHQVKVWDLASVPQEYRLLHPVLTERIGGVTFTADGRRLASASRDRTVRLWEAATGRQIRILTGHLDEVRCVAFGAADKLLASGSYDGTVKLWDLDTGKMRHTLAGHEASIESVACSPDGRWVAAAGNRQTVSVWDATSSQRVQTLTGHRAKVSSVAFSPDGRWLASAGHDKTVKLWDTQTWQELRTLEGFKEAVYTVAFSSDGTLLAAAGHRGGDGVKLWDPVSGHLIHTLEGLWGNIYSVSFSPDGRRLAAAGADSKLKIWDTARGQEVLTLKGHTSIIYSIAFSPDGRWLASAGGEVGIRAAVRLWEAPPDGRIEPEDRAALLTPEYVFRWRLNEAEDCLQAGQRSAAVWHVNRLAHPPLTDPLLCTRHAGIRAKLGQWAEAIDAAEAALQQQPDDPDARYLRGQACQKLGRHAEAVADFTVALTRNPPSARLYELRAVSQAALGKPDLARADRERAVKLVGKSPTALNSEAWGLVTGPPGQRNPTRALELIQEAIKQQPGDTTFLNTLGVVQYRGGQYKEAVSTLEKNLAVGRGQFDAFDLYFLAMCHAKLDDAAKARDCFDRAVKWTEAQKNLPAKHVEELTAFRAEAEAELAKVRPR
jgi:WD40 repeat protein/serine/threonine protein kinase/Flp pilus assembly protein TadD